MEKSPNSTRGVSYGGGQSSLGYLFGDDKKQQKIDDPPPSPTVLAPPYGIDDDANANNPSQNSNTTSITYQKSQGQNSGIFITGRPSTKVNSVPGGDSSLGYLFGDNKS
ncbi:Protein SPIRAL1-like 5 [Capsicum chinense]|uniref:Protein SPIRAL1-like 5 n=1 Tax=Capsicum annuum TaxID=4072 RepID=A0A1U8F955_CAPAN|nr:protein SPIRAL1-like 5 [Capsicum annuum]KAF3649635.1 Protein SPIRAL1-like 5 [Capsicum annuum]PHT92360.1 Protein SPIRAL1-like 5 [Capsicum annuum]PHU28047.1 Protein SPIRAL1-like 5 [Capsicum chinense]